MSIETDRDFLSPEEEEAIVADSAHPGAQQTPTKAIVVAVVGILGVLVQYLASGEFNQEETVGAITVAVAALGAYLARNKPKADA